MLTVSGPSWRWWRVCAVKADSAEILGRDWAEVILGGFKAQLEFSKVLYDSMLWQQYRKDWEVIRKLAPGRLPG